MLEFQFKILFHKKIFFDRVIIRMFDFVGIGPDLQDLFQNRGFADKLPVQKHVRFRCR